MKSLFSMSLLFLVQFGAAHAGTLKVDSFRAGLCDVTFGGVIQSADAPRLSKLLAENGCQTVTFTIESSGGDVDAALAIGRTLRKAEARTGSCRCESACVFVHIAGVERFKNCGVHPRRFGLHRLYWDQLSTQLTAEEVSVARRQMINRIRSYISEMNASPSLVSLMEAIPPESVRYLSPEEIRDFGIDGEDPVWNERKVARAASLIGITSSEYRRRTAIADDRCDLPRGNSDTATWLREQDTCRNSILWGFQPVDYERARTEAAARCKDLDGATYFDCNAKFMRAVRR